VRERLQSADLIDDVGHQVSRRDVDEPSADPGKVAVADLRADPHAVLCGLRTAVPKRGGIARVNAATTIITMHGDYEITANFEELPPVNWLLIGGIIAAAAVVAGLVIFFVHRRRAARTKRQGRKRVAREKRR